jgi:hypothetical protein
MLKVEWSAGGAAGWTAVGSAATPLNTVSTIADWRSQALSFNIQHSTLNIQYFASQTKDGGD